MTAPHLVIVDDNREFRDVLQLLLPRRFDVAIDATFDNAEAALAHLHQQGTDIVLVDYKMPGMNGIDFIQAASTLPAPPRTFLVSFNPLPELREAALAAGATAVLSKSDIEADLVDLLPRKQPGGGAH